MFLPEQLINYLRDKWMLKASVLTNPIHQINFNLQALGRAVITLLVVLQPDQITWLNKKVAKGLLLNFQSSLNLNIKLQVNPNHLIRQRSLSTHQNLMEPKKFQTQIKLLRNRTSVFLPYLFIK